MADSTMITSGGAAPGWVEPAARVLRAGVDAASLAALFLARPGDGGTARVLLFWALSLVAFPYPRIAAHVRQRREAHLSFLVGGVVLVLVGAVAHLGGFGERLCTLAPASETIWLGAAMAFAGAAQLRRAPDAAAPAPMRHFALGLASIAAGAIWLWLLRG